jgi:hypothetical protein
MPASFATQSTTCSTFGGWLVTIDDLSENTYLYNTFGTSGALVYIGLNDITVEGTFVWQQGTSTYLNWYANGGGNEPNGGSSENCVALAGSTATGQMKKLWNDVSCSIALEAICEVYVSPTSSPTQAPTLAPTFLPSPIPTNSPTFKPSLVPSRLPTVAPTFLPTSSPTQLPTSAPSFKPTLAPTANPTSNPSFVPNHVSHVVSYVRSILQSDSGSYSASDSYTNCGPHCQTNCSTHYITLIRSYVCTHCVSNV